MATSFTLSELANLLGAELKGDGDTQISGLATLQDAKTGQIAFLANPAYQRFLPSTEASAVILNQDAANEFSGNALILANPYLGYAKLSATFDNSPKLPIGVHPTAVVADSCELGEGVSIGPNAVVGDNTSIGDGTVIGAGAFVDANCVIGSDCQVAANATIYHSVVIGNEVIIHSSAVIGADGFGFAPDGGDWVKIHQLGGVVIGNRVEIGAATTIDRGALGNTELADGVKIDNHVMIAHNVKVGENTAMAAFTGISGSTTIGKNCTFAGRSGAIGHIDIGDNVHVAGATVMMKSVTEPGAYAGGTPTTKMGEWRRNAARFNQLDEMSKRIRRLEKRLDQSGD